MINESTKVLARLHPATNGRGLNIYNPYFEAAGINAVYVLFANENIEQLLSGIRALGIAGGVVAGSFETDPSVLQHLDGLSPISERLGTVGYVAQGSGGLIGDYQGAYGLRASIAELGPVSGRHLSILGAGNVVRGLLLDYELSGEAPSRVTLFARDEAKGRRLAEEFEVAEFGGTVDDAFLDASGDVLVNATPIGSPWNGGLPAEIPADFVARFEAIVDVTFVPPEPPLVDMARKLGKPVVPGHVMFRHQAAQVLRGTLGVELTHELFEPLMLRDFATNWS